MQPAPPRPVEGFAARRGLRQPRTLELSLGRGPLALPDVPRRPVTAAPACRVPSAGAPRAVPAPPRIRSASLYSPVTSRMRRALREELFGRRTEPARPPARPLFVRSLEDMAAMDAAQLADGISRGLVLGPAIVGGPPLQPAAWSAPCRRSLAFESREEMVRSLQTAFARARGRCGAALPAARLRLVALDGADDGGDDGEEWEEGPEAEEEHRPATAGLAPGVIAAREGAWRPRTAGGDPCAICREAVGAACEAPHAAPLELPCGHAFHGACLRRWLAASGVCPVCRRPP